MRIRCLAHLIAALPCLGLGASIDYASPNLAFSIGGTVEGAAGVLTLQNSNGTMLNVTADGSFNFETRMVTSALYNVTVAVPPRAQTCTVRNGSGTVRNISIGDVIVTCKKMGSVPISGK